MVSADLIGLPKPAGRAGIHQRTEHVQTHEAGRAFHLVQSLAEGRANGFGHTVGHGGLADDSETTGREEGGKVSFGAVSLGVGVRAAGQSIRCRSWHRIRRWSKESLQLMLQSYSVLLHGLQLAPQSLGYAHGFQILGFRIPQQTAELPQFVGQGVLAFSGGGQGCP